MDEWSCRIMELPLDDRLAAAQEAVNANPANAPLWEMSKLAGMEAPTPQELAALTGKFWGRGGKELTVYFMDSPSNATRRVLLEYLNIWRTRGKANVRFVESADQGSIIRLDRDPAAGYWCYLGTDLLRVPRQQPTMNLAGLGEGSPEATLLRVVPHEAGHALGCPHEHLRRDVVARIVRSRAYAYFARTSGWSRAMVDANVLTPLEDSAIMGTPQADLYSIMTYPLPGEIMEDGIAVPGGTDLSASDIAFIANLYPLEASPPAPILGQINLDIDPAGRTVTVLVPSGWVVR